MTPDITYLEFSDVSSNSHKFYEVSIQGTTVTIRFGRVQTQGTTQVKTYTTPAQAQADAQKKIREKQRKGYQLVDSQNAIQPANRAEIVTPPQSPVTSSSPPSPTIALSQNSEPAHPPAPTPALASATIVAPNATHATPEVPHPAPIRWRFDSGSTTFGIAVDADHCWLGNEKGQVFKLDHQGKVLQKFQLPDSVKCIVADDIWIYVGCDNGNIYDLTGKFPYLAYEVEKGVDIFWLSIYDGILAISDANGGITKTDPEGEILWTRLSPGKMGWMLCGDAQGFYHGHTKGVTMYEFATGQQIWHQATIGKVLFGCQAADRLYAATSGKQIQCFSKAGELLTSYPCGASVYACTTDDRGNLYAADSSALIYCFDPQGELQWKVSTGCGSALSMQYFQDALYLVTNQGIMACADVSGTALQSAQGGHLPTAITVKPEANLPSQNTATLLETTQETTSEVTQGVILECIRQGQKLRVRAVSEGYHQDWMVQFPKDLRREGDRYWVQELKEAKQGGFYRAYGDIKRLV